MVISLTILVQTAGINFPYLVNIDQGVFGVDRANKGLGPAVTPPAKAPVVGGKHIFQSNQGSEFDLQNACPQTHVFLVKWVEFLV